MSEPFRSYVQCDGCGALVEEGSAECPSCGAAVVPAAVEETPEEAVSRGELFGRFFGRPADGEREADEEDAGGG